MAKKTPEGRVKDDIDKYLNSLSPDMSFDKPVVTYYGKRLVDYLCTYKGRAIFLEAKAGRNKPTRQQIDYLIEKYRAGGISIVARDVKEVMLAVHNAEMGYNYISPELEKYL